MILSIRKQQVLFILSYIIILVFIKDVQADSLKLAVASNFLKPMKTLASIYEKETNQRVLISSGSTGKLYAQIIHGAPYDLFFSANKKEPLRLENSGYAIAGSRMTYAVGKIILWSKNHDIANKKDIKAIFLDKSIKSIAIANPKTAPYGVAAMNVIDKLEISLDALRLIKGENINQAWQFSHSGSVDIGFIAASQFLALGKYQGFYLEVPRNYYTAIEQQAVLLTSSKQQESAQRFLTFMKRADIKQRIAKFGYDLEDVSNSMVMR